MNRLLCIVLACLSTTIALGQREIKKSKDRAVSVMYFKSPKDAPSLAYVSTGVQWQQVKFHRNRFSDPIKIPTGDKKLTFLPEPLEVGKPMPRNAPFVNIPNNWQKVLLLVFEDPEN
ncbi:hypothetical protein OAB00_02330, partial [Akkermansiaceae bacterium]|nr:hypothetical protein [Akkermansiaceae bacterium]